MNIEMIQHESIRNPYLKEATITFGKEEALDALKRALYKIDRNMEEFSDQFPNSASVNYKYETDDMYHGGWNQGFWTGMLWHAYLLSGEEKYKTFALNHIPLFLKRIEQKAGVNHHDMGFLYSPSCVAAYQLTGNENARKAALLAADHLTSRYTPQGKFIQAWGNLGEDNRLIVDCLMNIPLLYWASEESKDPKYRQMAYQHFRTTIENTIRADAGSYQTFLFDKDTGAPIRGIANQGLSDDSTWSRGQGWCIYGMMLTRKYIDDPDALSICKKMANYYINRLPKDFVPYWDLAFTEGDQPRDTSAAAIVLCGLMELVKHLPDTDPDKEQYQQVIYSTLHFLAENYSTADHESSNGLLTHATYSVPHNLGVNECNIWGDYFYMEALTRLLIPNWKCWW